MDIFHILMFVWKGENKQKRPWMAHFFKKNNILMKTFYKYIIISSLINFAI